MRSALCIEEDDDAQYQCDNAMDDECPRGCSDDPDCAGCSPMCTGRLLCTAPSPWLAFLGDAATTTVEMIHAIRGLEDSFEVHLETAQADTIAAVIDHLCWELGEG